MNPLKIIVAISSILFIMIGIDKFYPFMEPSCSLMTDIHPALWKGLGILDLLAGILIWLPKYRRPVSAVFFILMLVFIVIHLTHNTYDIGGAAFMAILMGLLLWNPAFLKAQSGSKN